MKKGKYHTAETKLKMSLWQKGRPSPTKETRRKMSKSHKGINVWSKGGKQTEETKEKMRKPKTKETKEKMGIAQIKRYDKIGRKKHKRYYHLSNSKKYRQWRSDVFTRDNWTCQTCQVRGIYLEAHHIKSWAKFPKLRYEISNGVTLCQECHKLAYNWK